MLEALIAGQTEPQALAALADGRIRATAEQLETALRGRVTPQYLRMRSRRGAKKAIGAVADSILPAIHHMLNNGTLYQDLGENHFDTRAKGQQVSRLVHRLKYLGYAVELAPIVP